MNLHSQDYQKENKNAGDGRLEVWSNYHKGTEVGTGPSLRFKWC